MAKNNKNRTNYYNNNGGSKSKRGIIGVIVAITISVLLLAVAAGVMGYGTNGWTDWSFNNFTHKTEYTAPVETENNGGAIITPAKSNGISLMAMRVAVEDYEDYGIDTQSVDSVFNLSVTYTPANTTFQETDYTVAFKNPNSTWAKGKNVASFATITQSVTGSKNAQLKILNPFSEQIIVTARNSRHQSIYATTTVDYVCSELNIALSTSYVCVDEDLEISNVSWTGGTLTPVSAGNISIIFNFGSGFVNHMKNYGFTVPQTYEHVFKYASDFEEEFFTFGTFYDFVKEVGNYSNLTNDRKAAYQDALCQYYASYDDGDGVCTYTFKYNRVYNGVNYGTVTDDDWRDLECREFSNCFEIAATSMTISNSHIIAG